MKVAVLGTGNWGRTLTGLLVDNGHQVHNWSPRCGLPLGEVMAGSEVVVSAVAMTGVRSTISQVQEFGLPAHTLLVTATKGLDPLTTNTPSYLWQQTFPGWAIVVLSGPNLAEEIQQKLPAACVVASRDAAAAQTVQITFNCRNFRVYTNADPLGVELGGTLKNIMAIAAGTCDGLQLGTNAKAALLTRGLAEMIRAGVDWGAQMETFYGLSGLGDLLATCNSPLSRNYRVGYALAQGKSLSQVISELNGTAEGVNTTHVLNQRSIDRGLNLPITKAVQQLLTQEITPQEAVRNLMDRHIKAE